MTNGKRDYAKEYAKYHSSDEQKKNRAARNTARRQAIAAGQVSKGDSTKDVDHKRPLSKGGSNAASNRRVVAASTNRSFARTKTGKIK